MEEWIKECEQFQSWFAALGGNIANNEQMLEAFKRIETKGQSDNRLIELLDNDKINNLEVIEFTKL
jgi:hypothetical protein